MINSPLLVGLDQLNRQWPEACGKGNGTPTRLSASEGCALSKGELDRQVTLFEKWSSGIFTESTIAAVDVAERSAALAQEAAGVADARLKQVPSTET